MRGQPEAVSTSRALATQRALPPASGASASSTPRGCFRPLLLDLGHIAKNHCHCDIKYERSHCLINPADGAGSLCSHLADRSYGSDSLGHPLVKHRALPQTGVSRRRTPTTHYTSQLEAPSPLFFWAGGGGQKGKHRSKMKEHFAPGLPVPKAGARAQKPRRRPPVNEKLGRKDEISPLEKPLQA